MTDKDYDGLIERLQTVVKRAWSWDYHYPGNLNIESLIVDLRKEAREAIDALEAAQARIAALEAALRNAQIELREVGHSAADPFESDEDYTENFPAIAERAFSAASAIDAVLKKEEGK